MNDSPKNQRDVTDTDPQNLPKAPWKWPAVYTAILTLSAIAALVVILYRIDQLPNCPQILPMAQLIILVLVAGAIGGCLFNMHSIVKHIDRGDFDQTRATGYYLCPISGAVCGLIVVILLLGGVLTLGLGSQAEEVMLRHPGRLMPFIAAAIIAGYGARQFKKKLDELAETLFRTDADRVRGGDEESSQRNALEGGGPAGASKDGREKEPTTN